MVKILVVDDSEYFREVIKEILIREGYTIIGEASDGAEAVEKFKALRPDITTLDVTMPGMDGLEALKRILEFDLDAKVIMVSSSAQHNKVSQALIVGAYEFLPKPFDEDKLLEVVADIVSGLA